MAIQIEIQERHADLLINFYIDRLKIVKNEILMLERESKEINNQIIKLKKGKNNSVVLIDPIEHVENNLPNGYSEKWPWAKKIEFAINVKGTPLTTKEIVETLIEYEVGLMFERKKAVASISSILSTKSGIGKDFLRVETETGEFAYEINQPNTQPSLDDSSGLDF